MVEVTLSLILLQPIETKRYNCKCKCAECAEWDRTIEEVFGIFTSAYGEFGRHEPRRLYILRQHLDSCWTWHIALPRAWQEGEREIL